jgi:hypothetical protein
VVVIPMSKTRGAWDQPPRDNGLTHEITLKARPWQRPLRDYFHAGGKRAVVVAHRRAGKDRVALFIELEQALRVRCEVWHCLPTYKQARKVVWDALTGDGERLIDVAFPRSIVRKRIEDEMKIELITGSLWRLVGADNFDALVGANPKHVTFSEYALTSPKAYEFVRPILAENGGSLLFITTPRGYNHAHALYTHAQTAPAWYAGYHPVSDTHLIQQDVLEEERRTMPDELYRQEYDCDFSAANVGSILGSYLEQAERDGRIAGADLYDPGGAPIELFSDIGFRDAAAWWWVQPCPGGFNVIDHDEATGLDAEQWIERIRAKPWSAHQQRLGCIHLPHDARAKTFRSRHTVVTLFLNSQLADRYSVVPQTTVADRINAARVFVRTCSFNRAACAAGLHHLREWHFHFDEDRHNFGREPEHDEHSHSGDAFSYAAVALKPYVPSAAPPPADRDVGVEANYAFDLNRLFEDRDAA